MRCRALSLALALWAALPAAAQIPLSVGKAAATADPIIPVNVGSELGIFKKHGLDLKIVDFSGGGKLVQAMVAGSIDIGDAAGTEMVFVAKGVPMRAVCENTTTYPFLSIGVPYDSPIAALKDLKGRKIGVSTAGSLTEWLAQELARKQGWGPDGMTTVAIGNGTASTTAAMKSHLVDADIAGTSTFLAMEEQKVGRLLAPVTAFEGKSASGTLFAAQRLIDRDPGALRAFLAAWIETIQYIRTHKAETVRIERGITGFSESVMAKEYNLVLPMFTKDCRFDAESLATLQRSFLDLKLVDHPPDMAALYTEAFLPK